MLGLVGYGLRSAPCFPVYGRTDEERRVETRIDTKSLLIIEDNDVTREGFTVVLSLAGYSTREAANGRQAVEALRAAKPDLILLDMLLSGNGDDGWAILRKIRRNPEWR